MRHRVTLAAVLLLALLVGACERDRIETPTSPEPVPVDTIEFRVTGNVASARVRSSDPINGLATVVTGLPFYLSTQSTRANIFLSLDATTLEPAPVGQGVLVVSILINGEVFREASSVGFAPVASVSGTFRR